MEHTKLRIALIDIESSPLLGYAFGFYETNILKVVKPYEMLSFAYKWYGQNRTYCYSRKDYTEKQLLKKFKELLDEAQIVVGHNSDKFDLPMVKTFFVKNGMKPPLPYKTVDTLKIARSKFRFSSNRLGDLAEYLDVGKKLDTGGKELWFDCMNGDVKALRKMERYNKNDIFLLEGVYKILRPYANHPDVFLTKAVCPMCGSKNTMKRGFDYLTGKNGVIKRQRYSCASCGKYIRGEIVK